MLRLKLSDVKVFDETKGDFGEFITIKGGTLLLEHSLLSIYKWESKWNKPFLSSDKKTTEEALDYIRCMVIGGDADESIVYFLPNNILDEISTYIDKPMTATTFGKPRNQSNNSGHSGKPVTAEVIYWEMITLGIPIEFESRNFNHLRTLIKVCSIKNSPPTKRSSKSIAKDYKRMNEERRKKYNTKG